MIHIYIYIHIHIHVYIHIYVYHIVPYRIMSYHIISYRNVSYRIVSFHIYIYTHAYIGDSIELYDLGLRLAWLEERLPAREAEPPLLDLAALEAEFIDVYGSFYEFGVLFWSHHVRNPSTLEPLIFGNSHIGSSKTTSIHMNAHMHICISIML